MAKKVAVIAVNPVNGSGLFQYLEAFYENKINYETFAIHTSKEIKTNSGVGITLDGIIADLKGRENEFDAIVFACGDAMIPGSLNDEKAISDALGVLAQFSKLGKIIVGHCAAAIMFENAGITEGKKVSVHPLGKPAISKAFVTDETYTIDGTLYTAQCEDSIVEILPHLLKVLS